MEFNDKEKQDNKNAEVMINIEFKKEKSENKCDINSIDFDDFVIDIIQNKYEITNENLEITCCSENSELDTDMIKNILIKVSQEYRKEIDTFYANIKEEVHTLIDNEELEKEIDQFLREKYEFKIN